jgi:hypothetical protein
MLLLTFRIIIGAAGGLILYVALFLREPEEGRLQNLLEEWWVKLDDVAQGTVSRHTRFMNQLSSTLDSALIRLLGPSLWSVRAFIICSIVALSGLYANILLIAVFGSNIGQPPSVFETGLSAFLCVAFAVSAYQFGLGSKRLGAMIASLAFGCFLFFPPVNMRGPTRLATDLVFLVALAPSFIIDAVLVALARIALRYSKLSTSAVRIGISLFGAFACIIAVRQAVF